MHRHCAAGFDCPLKQLEFEACKSSLDVGVLRDGVLD